MPLSIIRNDITRVEADAIVNTANPHVAVGRGTDYAIYKAAGMDKLIEARNMIGDIAPGHTAVTHAFGLNAKYIIHTVGPAWKGGNFGERETVASCYRNCLSEAARLKCESVAFPLISTGTYGFPKDEALNIAIREISGFLESHDMDVELVVYDRESFVLSSELFADIRSYIDDAEDSLTGVSGAFNSYIHDAESFPRSSGEFNSYIDQRSELRQLDSPAAPARGWRGRFGKLFSRREAREDSGKEYSEEYRDEYRDEYRGDYGDEYQDEFDSDFVLSKDEALSSRCDVYGSSVLEATEYDAAEESSILATESAEDYTQEVYSKREIDDALAHLISNKDESFQQKLFGIIDSRGLTDPEVYKKANIDRKLFSKIRSNVDYKPTKKTAVAFAIALGLNLDETTDLLRSAGLSLSPSNSFDIIIRYCIEHRITNIHEINCILFEFDQMLLGA